MQSPAFSLRVLALAGAAILVCIATVGCSTAARVVSGQDPVSSAEPAAADLTTPLSAVDSYLAWVSYAYRVAVSDVASNTMSPEESVRVDSYVQYNLQEKNRRIDQQLVEFDPRLASEEGTRAVVSARERWEYRYMSVDGMEAVSPSYTVSYDTTYTVVRTPAGVWVVDSVEAAPTSELQ